MHKRKALCGPGHGLDNVDWLELGRSWSTGEIPLQLKTHDVGFMSFPFVEELRVNENNKTAINAIIQYAQFLAGRFNPRVGCTRSWNSRDPQFIVIIDNMMNLDVLFTAADLTGNNTLREIAITHAKTTHTNHIRKDGSTWHVVEYNSNTGMVSKKRTAQGHSDSSTWSRGQAWAIYSFSQMHHRTGYFPFLETARRTASYFVANLPRDRVVPWDFDAPTVPSRPADSSAATIAVNGLILLSEQERSLGNATGADIWLDSAQSILEKITRLAWRPEWQSLLANGTVAKPSNNFNTGIVYGDYYFVRAGNELIRLGLASCGKNSG
ncbi:hypothetical protein ONZ45_g780 [Pleurotus djamor]|nr:hypothetical protein ONZ45_g780 [Pleurotus djamor]